MKKILSALLVLTIYVSQLSVVSVASYDDTDCLSVDKFAGNLVELINEGDGLAEFSDSADLLYSSADGVQADVEEPVSSTLRLIVKSEEKLPELDSVGYIYGYNDLHILQFDNRESLEKAKEYYTSLSCVEYVEEDKILTAAELDEGVVVESAADYPTSVQSNLFGYSTAKANSASGSVDIAVIDSGVQHDHDFLKGRVVDTGFNAISDNGTAYDDRGHGTHVAGIIAANTNNNVTIYAYKVLGANGEGTATQVSLGIEAAIEDGVDIINLSVQMSGHSTILYDAVKKAYDAGIAVVVAAGNAGVDLAQTTYSPGSFAEAISVMSCSNSRRISSTSNYGTPCDFAAPGENILSTYINNTYKISSGTSMAAPFICAAASYLLAEDSSLSPDEVATGLSAQAQWCYGSPAGKCVYPATKKTVSGKTATPSFELNSCGFLGSMRVAISCADSADIYYSIGGAATYKEYTEPFYVTETTTINAFAVSDGKYSSDSASVTYTLLEGNASDFTVDETGTLIAYNGSAVSVSVPSYVNGNRIANVASTAFGGNTNVSSVVFEASLTNIGENAFVGCTNLVSVTAPGVTAIENNAFKECENLVFVKSYELKNIGESAFYGCPLLANVLHDKVESVGANAFENTQKFTIFSSPYIKEIGLQAFKNSGITTLGISSATIIGDYAFSGCEGITEAVLTSATSIGTGAFENCVALTTVSAPVITSISEYCFDGCEKLTTVSFTAAALVDSYAFRNCVKLSKFTGFSAVKRINSYAFENATFSSISSTALTTLEPYAFKGCWNLTNITLNGLTSVDLTMFEGANHLSYFTFNNATELIFPENGLASLYPSLKSLKASKITELPDNAFNGCSSFDTHSFSNLVSVGANAFKGTAITEIGFSSLATAGEGAFSNMTKLTKVSLPVIKEISTDMFIGDTAVTSAYFKNLEVFPADISVKDMFPNIKTFSANTVEEIPARMFKDCTKLNSATFENLYTIGEEAFQNCNFTTISFYADTIGENAFDGNPAKNVYLNYLEVMGEQDIFGSSADTIQYIVMDVLTDLSGNTFTQFPNLQDVQFKALTTVPDGCFRGLDNLTTVSLPAAESVGSNAFNSCSNLQIIELDSAKTIGTNAFYNCSSLAEFYADSIEEIDTAIFDGCSNLYVLSLNSLTSLPSTLGNLKAIEMFYANSVKEVPAYTFQNCTNLHTVSISNATKIGDYAFVNTALSTITANAGTIGTCAFMNTPLKTFTSSAVHIGESAFMGCTSLTTVKCGLLETIGDRAFKNCSALNKFTYSDYMTVDIGDEAFYGCSNFYVLDRLTPCSIGSKALYGTKSYTNTVYELDELVKVSEDAFEGFNCDVLVLENVEEIYDVPEGAKVLIGTDVTAGAISNDTTATIYSPAGSVVSKYCIANGVNYLEFNETNPIVLNTNKTVSAEGESLSFQALGFNLKYNWYACNKADMSDAVFKSDKKSYTPFTTSTNGDEGRFKYYYCVATSTENGNVVNITSNLVRNTYTYVAAKNEKTEIDYTNGYIFTGEKDIDAVKENVYFEEGCCEFVPTYSQNGYGFYGTGASVKVYVNEEIKHTYVLILDGDVNGDGYVDVLDCATVAKAANGLIEITDENYEMACSYFDDTYGISVQDYQAIVNKAVS